MKKLLIAAFLSAASDVSVAKPSLLRGYPARALTDEMIELQPIDGHHFNPAAPQTCGGARAALVTPRRFRCQPRSPGKVGIVVSVCDDAKTFCRQERFEVAVAGAVAAREKAAARPHSAPPGFLINDPAKAAALSRRDHAPLFVHFYGIWCPPCNMLEEAVYPSEVFQRAGEGFVKLALDADAELSWDWKARFKVGGYPTLLVLDESGREIARAVGYRSPRALAAFLAEAKSLMSEPVEAAARAVAKAAPAEDGTRRARVARWRLERGEYAEAEAAAGLAPEARREALLARKERAAGDDDAAAVTAALKELTSRLPADPEFIDWASDLVERDKAAAEALSGAVRAGAARWAADPAVEGRLWG